MAENRLAGSEKRALVLWVLLGIVGVVFAQRYFFKAFPEASVNLTVPRKEVLSRAQRFISGLGEDVNGYRSAVVFDLDEDAKTYLEREVGLEQANRLMSRELNVWYWDVRFFWPLQQEEFHIQVSPTGSVVGYEHTIEESRAGTSPDREAAQSQAQNFLREKLGVDLTEWDILPEETSSKKLPNRMHWEFTWEKHGFKAKDAPYRLRAIVDGDRVNGSREFLKVPEEWERRYKRLRSSNDTLTLAFLIPYLALLGSAVALAIVLTRKGQATWGLAVKAGVLVAVLLFLQDLNNWPLWASNYNTTDAYGSFLAQEIARSLLVALFTAILTLAAITPSGEALYRYTQTGRLRLSRAFTRRGMRTKEFFSSAVVGVSLAGVHIGYLTVFYIVAGHFGAWAPQELNYENSVGTAFPWIAGAAIGVTAATSEEFLFRMFAIPFVHRLTKSRWTAVIVPAFLWSFLHSNYPQEPAYVRGIEIGIMGILAGLVMLRWGILATLIWHYTVDASLVGLLLIRSSSPYLRVSGVVVGLAALIPLAYCAASRLKRGAFETDQDLVNSTEPVTDVSFRLPQAASETAVAVRRYDALSSGKILFIAACLVLGTLVIWRVRVPHIGDYLKVSADARKATAAANEIMKKRGLDPGSYHHPAVLVNVTDADANEFLRERIGITALNEIYATRIPGVLWRVRYFRDSQAEEYAVILKPDGSLHSVRHTLAENAPGASLRREEALAKAEKYLREEKNLDLTGWSLVEANPEKKPKRVDYQLIWQQDAPLDAANVSGGDAANHAYARFELDVLGDEPANYRTYIKIPEEWERKQSEMTLGRILLNFGIPILVFGGLGITALAVFLKNLKSEAMRAVPWKRMARWACATLALFVLSFATGNVLANSMNLYRTEIPFKAMIAVVLVQFLVGGAIYWAGFAFLFGMAWFYAARAFREERIPTGAGMPSVYYRDAFCIGVGGSAALIAANRAIEEASAHWPTMHRGWAASFGNILDAVLPGASIVAASGIRGLFYAAIVALVAGFIGAALKARWLRWLLFLLVSLAFIGGDWGNGQDFAKQLIAQVILLGVIVIGMTKLVRFNILGCFLVVACISLLNGASELLAQPDSFYRMNGYAVLMLLALLLAWPLLAWRMRAGPPVTAPVGSTGE